ncbi:DUF6221 family protein [Kitasatospora sp. NPDC004615]|uniref:DUF6221 family protein n=1 Tax=Kitasatospora sp. NPDC004615 TaxID=3364017 RepID=UPI003681AF57
MSDNLVAFLRERLDEDERAASEAWPVPWSADAEEYGVVDPGDGTEIADVVVLSTNQQRATARHIARHDPARVLAEVAAKRRVVELWSHSIGTGGTYTLRALALPYREHPDFRPEWACGA